MNDLFSEVRITNNHPRAEGSRIEKGFIRVYCRKADTGKASYKISFNKDDAANIVDRGLRYATMVENNLTGELYLVLSIDKGINSVPISTCGGAYIYGKQFAEKILEYSKSESDMIDARFRMGKKFFGDKLVMIIEHGEERG